MRVDNLFPHISTGEENNSFVGLKIKDNEIHFYYPESYHFNKDNFEIDDVLDLLKTISIAKTMSSDAVDTFDAHHNESDYAFLSYIWIVEDYLKNGYYRNTEKILKANQKGRINWKQTMRQQPMVSGHNIVYPQLITEVISPRDSLLAEAYRYCVKKSADLIGWLYGLSSDSIEIEINAEQRIPIYMSAIKSERDQTFDDRMNTRLINMENVLTGLDESVGDNSIVYGVDEYYYIYERMINGIFGTEKAEDYYPKFKWHLKYLEKAQGLLPGPTIRPDTIMKDISNNNIYIIDSKFYRFGSLNLSKTKRLPESASIVKQITYGSYVQTICPKSSIYNVFILPYDSQSPIAEIIEDDDKFLVYVGNVSSDWDQDKTYGTVHTFLIDLRYVVRTWNRIIHQADQSKLVHEIENSIKTFEKDKAAQVL